MCAVIELRLSYGRSLRFDSGVDAAVLTRLMRAVEAAVSPGGNWHKGNQLEKQRVVG